MAMMFSPNNDVGRSVTPSHPPWQRLLYVKQDYPDNYVDETFLEELQKNANVRSYDYWTVVRESTIISQHLSSIIIFIAIFINLYDDRLPAERLIAVGSLFTVTGYVLYEVWQDDSAKKTFRIRELKATPRSTIKSRRQRTLKGAILLFTTLLGLSPILRTLTKDTSSDTIWAVTVILFLANLLLHDYGSGGAESIRFPGSLSTNAAIFASVLLASRLDTNLSVFGLMSFAVEWFALFPIFRRHLKTKSSGINLALSFALFCLAAFFFASISKAIMSIYILGIAFITFVCPFWLIWVQQYKNEIHGPWDIAQPKLQRSRTTDE